MSTDAENAPIHVIGLRAQDVQCLRLVDLDLKPEGGVVEIRGPNNAGKSTILACLQMALGGGRATSAQPIRAGCDHGEITVRTSNGLTITRRFTAAGRTYLVVRNAEGFQASRAQSMLDRLLGPGRTLDPHAFMLSTEAEQAESLRRIAGLDLRALDAEIEGAFDDRAAANRRLKAEQARLADMQAPPEGAELGDAPTDALEGELAEALAHNAMLETLRANVQGAELTVEDATIAVGDAGRDVLSLDARHRDEARDLAERHARESAEMEARQQREREEATRREGDLIQRKDKAERALQGARADLDGFAPADVDAFRARLADVRATNEERIAWREHARQSRAVDEAADESARLTSTLEGLRERRKTTIAEASMPIDGLGFDASGVVTYNGLPFGQAGHAEQLRVSLAIAMAASPDLRLIAVSDASLLDRDSMAIVRELAADRGYQVLAEIVDSEPGETGIFIADGRVAFIDGQAVDVDEDRADDAPRTATGDEARAAQAGDLDPEEPLS